MTKGMQFFGGDGVKVFEQGSIGSDHSTPKLLALGGSDANDHFSQSEVAEVLFFSRALNPSELAAMQEYLRVKWQGGDLSDFLFSFEWERLITLDFSLSSFADSANGGDLRFSMGKTAN